MHLVSTRNLRAHLREGCWCAACTYFDCQEVLQLSLDVIDLDLRLGLTPVGLVSKRETRHAHFHFAFVPGDLDF